MPFTKQNSADLFHAKPSRVHASISATDRIWHPNIVKIDLAAAANLIDIELLKRERRSHIQLCQQPRYTDAIGHLIRFHGVIIFYAGLSDMRTRIWFGVFRDLPPKVLLGNAFNSRHLNEIEPKAGLVRLVNYRPAPILATQNESMGPLCLSQPPESTRCIDSTLGRKNHDIRVARTRTKPTNSQYFIPVTMEERGLMSVASHPELLNRYWKTAAKKIRKQTSPQHSVY